MPLLPTGTEIDKSDSDSTSLSAAIDAVAGLTSAVGAALVTHTSDPSAHATEFGLKANLNSPTFTGTVGGITASMVGAPSGSGTSSGTNTGDQDLSSYLASSTASSTYLALSGGTLTGKVTSSYSPGLSDCAIVLTGALQTGGTGTTNLPALFFQPTGTTPGTAYSTGGTFIGVNAPSGFAGRFIDFRVDGAAGVFSINSAGWITMSGVFASSRSGTASNAAASFTGTILTGGTGTTNFPHILVQPSGATAATTWSTAGTVWGTNAATGFAGNFVDYRVAGAASVFNVNSAGVVNATGFNGTVGATTPAAGTFTTITASGSVRLTEQTYTPTGTTQTINLNSGNLNTLSLGSTTGNITLTLTVPTSAASGRIKIIQHGTTARGITIVLSAGTAVWYSTIPSWSSQAVSKKTHLFYTWDGTDMSFSASEAA